MSKKKYKKLKRALKIALLKQKVKDLKCSVAFHKKMN